MTFSIRKLPNKNLYRVRDQNTGKVVAKATADPHKVIQAIEINKRKNKKLSGGVILDVDGDVYDNKYNQLTEMDEAWAVHGNVERFRNNPNIYVVRNNDDERKFLVSLENLPNQKRNAILAILLNNN